MNADSGRSKRHGASGNPDDTLDSRAAGGSAGSEHGTVESGPSMLIRSSVEAAPTLPSGGVSSMWHGPGIERPGVQIGRYKLIQQIGEGGFGSVFLAEQREPVVRYVALKIIKLGMDTRQVIARFEQERQALALMDHPNIATVLDAGATDTGRPYFVMEFCTGEAITQFCDEHNLTISERLSLFVQVCQAVQHAHQKGIIHRDIKPGNILVSAQDGKPHVKVIDFGIAKATAKLTELTLLTAEAQFIGTPQYMSPEQAEGSLDIDTRTDVYALGVLLYELLTGVTPFDPKRLRSAAYAQMQRIIREVEPPRPSTRLSENTDTVASVAASRQVEPRKLSAILRGELDWIVMKALEKERQRRYETANDFAADILRYLAAEPVYAAPPSASYRFQKFVRRNRVAVLAGGAVAVSLILGIVAFAWQARIARDQRDRAVHAEEQANRRANELKEVADFQSQMLSQVDPTTAGMRLAEDVTARFDAALAKSGVPDNMRTQQVESFSGQWSRVNATDTALALIDHTILKPAVAAIDRQFVDQPAVAATLRHVLAERYHRLGLVDAALALEQQVLAERRRVLGEDHADTLISIGNVGVYLNALGRLNDAEPYYREALEKSRRVRGEEQPETLTCISNMGSVLRDKGQRREAEAFFREALEKRLRVLGEDHPETVLSISVWAGHLQDQGKLDEAETYYRRALEGRRRSLGEEHPDTLVSINNLASVLWDQRKRNEAILYFREATAKRRRILGEAHPSTLRSIQDLGTVLGECGYPAEAEALLREALTNQRRLLGADHPSALNSLSNLAVFLINQEKLTDAEPMCREALERRRRVLGEIHPETLLANNVMGFVLRRQDRNAEAEPFVRETLAISRSVLGPEHPDTFLYAHNLALLLRDQDKTAEAESLLQEVCQTGGPAMGASHPVVLSATRKLGGMLLEQKRYAEAAELLSKSEAAARKTYVGGDESNLGAFLRDLGIARARLGQFAAGESNLIEAQRIFSRTGGDASASTRKCTGILGDFYAHWDKAEPGAGYDAKAADWKAKAEALNASSQPGSTSPAATTPTGQP